MYLSTPIKSLPTLSSGGLSDEEGDTWQNPAQRGYYSNMSREDVLNEVQKNTQISFLGLTIPNYRLNYRPEEAGSLVRDQLKSNYLEEIVYPLRSSVFVNGWEPKKAPIRDNKAILNTDLSLKGIPYEAKITFRPVNSSFPHRLLVWTLIFPATYLVYLSIRTSSSSRLVPRSSVNRGIRNPYGYKQS